MFARAGTTHQLWTSWQMWPTVQATMWQGRPAGAQQQLQCLLALSPSTAFSRSACTPPRCPSHASGPLSPLPPPLDPMSISCCFLPPPPPRPIWEPQVNQLLLPPSPPPVPPLGPQVSQLMFASLPPRPHPPSPGPGPPPYPPNGPHINQLLFLGQSTTLANLMVSKFLLASQLQATP